MMWKNTRKMNKGLLGHPLMKKMAIIFAIVKKSSSLCNDRLLDLIAGVFTALC